MLVFNLDGECLSAFVGIEIENRIYHITGGTKPNRLGAGTLMMLSIIKHLFETQRDAELVLGACWGNKKVEEYQTGALLYKRKLRVEAVNGIYDRIAISRSEVRLGDSFAWLYYRYLRPWVPLAALASSALSMDV